VLNVAGVAHGRWLEDQDRGFLLRNRTVFDPVRNDDELAGAQINRAVSKLEAKAPTHPQKELVLGFVMMPHEGASGLDELDLLAVELSDDLGAPVFGDQSQLFGDVNFLEMRAGWSTEVPDSPCAEEE
jgi:hypothetical protein